VKTDCLRLYPRIFDEERSRDYGAICSKEDGPVVKIPVKVLTPEKVKEIKDKLKDKRKRRQAKNRDARDAAKEMGISYPTTKQGLEVNRVKKMAKKGTINPSDVQAGLISNTGVVLVKKQPKKKKETVVVSAVPKN
jgi:hypothetical protein